MASRREEEEEESNIRNLEARGRNLSITEEYRKVNRCKKITKITVQNFQELGLKIIHGIKRVANGRQKRRKQSKKASKQERKQA